MRTALILVTFLFCLNYTSSYAQASTKNEDEIKSLLFDQAQSWSEGDIEGFMKGYWKSKELKFIGSKGLNYGWQKTLDNYKKGYPTKDHMGKLTFKIQDVSPIAKDLYHVVGSYHLERTVGNAEGIFSLVVKKINGEWKIIIDHSS